jgi:hypothetical protein
MGKVHIFISGPTDLDTILPPFERYRLNLFLDFSACHALAAFVNFSAVSFYPGPGVLENVSKVAWAVGACWVLDLDIEY